METTPYSSRLRYLDAEALDDSVVDFDGLDVYGWEREKLGDVAGFIVDATSGHIHYAVVDSGGWFRSRQFLLPIGHLTNLEADRKELHADLSKAALREYPEFDRDRFETFSDDDLRAFEQRTAEACCPDETAIDLAAWAHDSRRHYGQPAWWRTEYARSEGELESRGWTASPSASPQEPLGRAEKPPPSRDDREHVRAGDVSPHHGGRAQPGEVLGVDTGGERTHIGDTSDDENKRREDADRSRPD